MPQRQKAGGEACLPTISFISLPWTPLTGMGILRQTAHPAVQAAAQRHRATPLQVMLAWCIRSGNTLAIPKASIPRHVMENAAAALELTPEDLAELGQAFHAPSRIVPLPLANINGGGQLLPNFRGFIDMNCPLYPQHL